MATQTKLIVTVDSAQAAKVSTSLASLGQAIANAEKANQKFIRSTDQASSASQSLSTAMANSARDTSLDKVWGAAFRYSPAGQPSIAAGPQSGRANSSGAAWGVGDNPAVSGLDKQLATFNDSLATSDVNLEQVNSSLRGLTEQAATTSKAVEQASASTGLWAQMVGKAVSNVDGVFAEAWKSIWEGGYDLQAKLKAAFKNTLSEIGHMLTTKPLLASIGNLLTGKNNGQGLESVWGNLLGSLSGKGGESSGGGSLWSGAFGLVKDAYSAVKSLAGAWSAASGGYASGGIPGAISGVGSYFGSMFTSAASSFSSSVSSFIGAITGQTAANAASSAAAQVAGAAAGNSLGVNAGIYAASSAGGTSALSSAFSSAGAMWPLAVLMGMYQSGKLYDAGVRPDGDAIQRSGGDTALGKVVMFAPAMGARWLEFKDNLFGKALGGKLAAIMTGSTVFQAVYEKVGAKLFGTGYQTKDYGFAFGVENGDFDAQSYQLQKKKKGLISGSSKSRYVYGELSDEQSTRFGQLYEATAEGVASLVAKIGIAASDGMFDGLNIATRYVSTQGKTDEQIQTAVADWFSYASDQMVAYLDQGVGGFGYSFEVLAQRVGVFETFNNSLDSMNIKMLAANANSMEMANSLVDLAGGMQAYTTSVAGYYDAFLSDSERADKALAAVREQFSAMEQALPDTRDAYRGMVEALDLTTEAGRESFLKLTASAVAAAQAYDILESRQNGYYSAFYSQTEQTAMAVSAATAQLQEANLALPASRAAFRGMVEGIDTTTTAGKQLKEQMIALAGAADTVYAAQEAVLNSQFELLSSAVNASLGTVQRAVAAEKSAVTDAYNARVASLNDMLGSAQERAGDLRGIASALSSALKALSADSETAIRMIRDQARATVESALAIARAGGSLGSFAGLEDALAVLGDNDTSLYASLEDFTREQGRSANLIADLNGLTGKQLSADEQLIKTLQDQLTTAKSQYDEEIKRLDQQLDYAQQQVDALNGIDTSVISVREAMSQLGAAIAAATAAKVTALSGAGAASFVGTGTAGAPSANDINAIYQQVLGRDADVAGYTYWAGQLGSGVVDLASAIRADAIKNGEIRAYGTGGWHAGGIRLVGENGPELEVTGPARIFSAGQTAEILRRVGESEPALSADTPAQRYAGHSGGNGSAQLLVEVRQLRQENRQAQFQIAKNTQKLEGLMRKWDEEGTPQARDYAL